MCPRLINSRVAWYPDRPTGTTNDHHSHGLVPNVYLFELCDVNGVYDTDDHRNDAGIGVLQHLARTVTFAIDEHGVTDAGMRIIDGNEILLSAISLSDQRLHHQQPPLLVMRMADSGYNGSGNFGQDHLRYV